MPDHVTALPCMYPMHSEYGMLHRWRRLLQRRRPASSHTVRHLSTA